MLIVVYLFSYMFRSSSILQMVYHQQLTYALYFVGTLSITILDKNDNKPVFVSGNKYTASIRENAEVGIPLSLRSPSSMKVLDKDKV